MKKISLLIVVVLASFAAKAQEISILNSKTTEDFKNVQVKAERDSLREFIIYPYVEPRDIMWSLTVFEIIDLDQKMNLPLYFPIDEKMEPERKSLFKVLKDGIASGKIKEVFDDENFSTKLPAEEVIARLEVKTIDQVAVDKLAAGEALTAADSVIYTVTPSMISQYRIKGMWYFDKRYGELRYRILAIAPYGRDASGLKAGDTENVALFWVWYPDARKELNSYLAFNPKNAATSVSFDDIFNSRRFAGVIYKEENMYSDRAIEEYLKGNSLSQLRESDRIKEGVRNYEQDLWVY